MMIVNCDFFFSPLKQVVLRFYVISELLILGLERNKVNLGTKLKDRFLIDS